MNADIMNADMSVPTRQQISAQQRMTRLKNKIFLSAYRNGDSMTPEEEERGFRLQLARIKKKGKAARALSSDSWGGEETEEWVETEEHWYLQGGEGGSCEGEGEGFMLVLWGMQQPNSCRQSMF